MANAHDVLVLADKYRMASAAEVAAQAAVETASMAFRAAEETHIEAQKTTRLARSELLAAASGPKE